MIDKMINERGKRKMMKRASEEADRKEERDKRGRER